MSDDVGRDPAASLGSMANAGNPAAYLVEVEGIGSIMPICRDMVEVDGLRERFGERVRGVTPLYAWREWDEIRRAGEQVSREEGYKVMEAELIAIAAERDWIPATERLPDPRLVVAVYVQGDSPADRSITVAHHWRGQWRSTYAGEEPLEEWCNVNGEVTHWVPLPAPPADAK